MIGLLLGIALGVACFYSFPDKATAADVAKYMSLISTVFLKLIKMIIGPLVLSTLVVGIGHMGDAATGARRPPTFRRRRSRSRISSIISCRPRCSNPSPTARSCRSWLFSIFAGIAIMAMGEAGKPLLALADSVSHMMLNITGYVMKL